MQKGELTETKVFTVIIRAKDPVANVDDMIALARNCYDVYHPGSWWDYGAVLACWDSLEG